MQDAGNPPSFCGTLQGPAAPCSDHIDWRSAEVSLQLSLNRSLVTSFILYDLKDKMVSRIGLTELYRPKNDSVPTAQIVFVHGLFGHPEKTWSVENRDELLLWPRNLLPEVIPDVQIFTWGYDADVGSFFSSAGQSTIHEHAGSLLSDLSDLRDTPELRLIHLIFVVHSLGGIIVKDALNQSSSTEGTRLKGIAPATYGVVFLGTPHRGSKSASLGKLAYHITELVTRRPNIKLLQGLEKHSEILDRIGHSFNQTVSKHEVSIYSFREERETRKYGLFNTMVSIEPQEPRSVEQELSRR